VEDAAAVSIGDGDEGLEGPSIAQESKPYPLDEIRKEIDRIEESATWSAQGQFEHAKFWRLINVGMGVPTSLLAAVSGGTGLAAAGLRYFAAGCALLAAGLGGAMTTLNPGRRVAQAQAAANAYLALQTAARQLRLIDLEVMTPDEARVALQDLTTRRDELNQTADPPGRRAYKRAKKNLEEGGQTYAVDPTGGDGGPSNGQVNAPPRS
jgi:hypothetical protein